VVLGVSSEDPEEQKSLFQNVLDLDGDLLSTALARIMLKGRPGKSSGD